jgi:hypothetical protein
MNERHFYSKVLRLSSHSMNAITSGEITNLLSNDANKGHLALCFLNYLWVRFCCKLS